MITLVLALFLSTNTRMGEEASIPQNCADSIPVKKSHNPALMQHGLAGKIYCCTYCQAKYELIKQANTITIIYLYKERRDTIHGKLRNGRIYSDNPNEKIYKQSGRLYILSGDTFSVKNLENGDTVDYILCK